MKKIIILMFSMILYSNDFKVNVGVSLPPYVYFVQRIGGNFVDITLLIPEKKNPKTYDLHSDQIKQIKEFKLLVASGARYEKKWFDRLKQSNPSLRIVRVQNQCKEEMCYQWLDLTQVAEIAEQIAYYLRMIDVKNAQNYKENLENFLEEIQQLRTQISQIFIHSLSYQKIVDCGLIWKGFADNFHLQYISLQEEKGFRPKWCVMSPFDSVRQMQMKYGFSRNQILQINPFALDWRETLLKFAHFIAFGDQNGK